MSDKLANSILRFLERSPGVSILEITIDTSAPACTPYLNLWAWAIKPGSNFDDQLEVAQRQEDLGFVYDVLREIALSCFEISVRSLYPHWPNNIEEGDEAVRNSVARALEACSLTTRAFFHHVDVPELEEINIAA